MATFESPLDRIQARQNALDQPAICPKCGSRWFSEITYHRYAVTAYASADLEPKEAMPQPIRVCL